MRHAALARRHEAARLTGCQRRASRFWVHGRPVVVAWRDWALNPLVPPAVARRPRQGVPVGVAGGPAAEAAHDAGAAVREREALGARVLAPPRGAYRFGQRQGGRGGGGGTQGQGGVQSRSVGLRGAHAGEPIACTGHAEGCVCLRCVHAPRTYVARVVWDASRTASGDASWQDTGRAAYACACTRCPLHPHPSWLRGRPAAARRRPGPTQWQPLPRSAPGSWPARPRR